jgi:hypothetical protein
MAAGLGFKTFTTGEVLTSADVNGYLMQGVLVFASEAARDAAITSPQEGQFAFTKDNNSLWYYDSVAWVASGATGDIEGVTAGTGISGGGTSGTVTITNSMATEIDAKGDLVVGTGADTFARLAVGANGTVLTAASGEATGLEWAAPAGGGGKVLQVVSGTTTTQTVSASQTMADTTLTASITPTLATSKVLILVTQQMLAERFAEAAGAGLQIMRGATAILIWEGSALTGSNYLYQRIRVNSVDADRNTFMGVTGMSYLDSPATTSATTYKTQFRIGASGSSASAIAQYDSAPSTITLLEIGV